MKCLYANQVGGTINYPKPCVHHPFRPLISRDDRLESPTSNFGWQKQHLSFGRIALQLAQSINLFDSFGSQVPVCGSGLRWSGVHYCTFSLFRIFRVLQTRSVPPTSIHPTIYRDWQHSKLSLFPTPGSLCLRKIVFSLPPPGPPALEYNSRTTQLIISSALVLKTNTRTHIYRQPEKRHYLAFFISPTHLHLKTNRHSRK